jgi:hypothetical protein
VHYFDALRPDQIDQGREQKGDLMIPSQREPEDERARMEQEHSRADGGDRTVSDQDEGSADIDRSAGHSDQAATNEGHRMTSSERHNTASARDATAHERDRSAAVRDRAAEARDLEDEGWDAQIAGLTSFYETKRRQTVGRSSRGGARDREFAAEDRSHTAPERGADEQLSALKATIVRQPPPSGVDPLDTSALGS